MLFPTVATHLRFACIRICDVCNPTVKNRGKPTWHSPPKKQPHSINRGDRHSVPLGVPAGPRPAGLRIGGPGPAFEFDKRWRPVPRDGMLRDLVRAEPAAHAGEARVTPAGGADVLERRGHGEGGRRQRGGFSG